MFVSKRGRKICMKRLSWTKWITFGVKYSWGEQPVMFNSRGTIQKGYEPSNGTIPY